MFEPGDSLGARFELERDVCVVGDVSADHLHGHQTIGDRLAGPVDRAIEAMADRFDQFISAYLRDIVTHADRSVIRENLPFQIDELGRRIETGLVGQ